MLRLGAFGRERPPGSSGRWDAEGAVRVRGLAARGSSGPGAERREKKKESQRAPTRFAEISIEEVVASRLCSLLPAPTRALSKSRSLCGCTGETTRGAQSRKPR